MDWWRGLSGEGSKEVLNGLAILEWGFEWVFDFGSDVDIGDRPGLRMKSSFERFEVWVVSMAWDRRRRGVWDADNGPDLWRYGGQ